MTRIFYAQELESIASFWRISRRDGVTLGFTTHDRDIWLDGLLHRAAPGMLPSAIRRTASLEPDSADVEGALSHDAIASADLAAGRYDGARIQIGVLDWETLESAILYHGEMGAVSEEASSFSAELASSKVNLEADPVPRTSPTCRAQFCGPVCNLPSGRFTVEMIVLTVDYPANTVHFLGTPDTSLYLNGQIRWIDGPQAGTTMQIASVTANGFIPDAALAPGLASGMRALLREGCDHTVTTCGTRFGNAANFDGEPFLPGNDLLARYGQASK